MSFPVVLLIVLVIAYAVAFAYKKMVEGSSDELVHVSDPSGAAISKQSATAKKLEQLDRLVTIAGVLLVVYAVGWGAFAIYQAFLNNGSQAG